MYKILSFQNVEYIILKHFHGFKVVIHILLFSTELFSKTPKLSLNVVSSLT